jgi:hypothetical protein
MQTHDLMFIMAGLSTSNLLTKHEQVLNEVLDENIADTRNPHD